ncbi:alpha/beta fold hydrolase [Streptosporangium sp. CA-135522]|uniref:alpha/beta fold hydrolase n=1 Tax=Streptosporangium sp. CA-135522 TaxID=3240072 RepID=UPI003D8F70F8
MPSASATAADHAADHGAEPTIVLVHGGFADASGWNAVIERLQHDGYTTIAPANPLRGPPADAPYIKSVLKSIDGPVVLVGHSYGGAVITNAAAGLDNVKALVYIAAFASDKSEQLGVLINKYPGTQIPTAVKEVPYPGGVDLYLRPDAFRAAFAADLPVSTTRLMQATQRPFAASSFTDTTTGAAWHTIPSWAPVATQDKAVPPALETAPSGALRPGTHTISIRGVLRRYPVAGTGPVCLVHPGGPGLGGEYLRMPHLKRHLTLVYLEPIGTGGSGHLPRPRDYRIDTYAQFLHELATHLQTPHPFLIGHSHGGFVAQHYALTHPTAEPGHGPDGCQRTSCLLRPWCGDP